MKTSNIKTLTGTALMAAVLCVIGPLTVPVGPVPVSLVSFVIYLFLFLLDGRKAFYACLLYLLIGFAGLPVFSGFTGGIQRLFGPTGGFLIGYLPLAAAAGFGVRRTRGNRLISILVLEAATWILYLLGTLWLSLSTEISFSAALKAAVYPFVLLDLIKITAAAFLGPALRERLKKAGAVE